MPDGWLTRERIGQPRLQIDVTHFRRNDQTVHGGSACAAAFVSAPQAMTTSCTYLRKPAPIKPRHQITTRLTAPLGQSIGSTATIFVTYAGNIHVTNIENSSNPVGPTSLQNT